MMQLSFDFALEMEQRAEGSEEPDAPNGADELRDFLGRPASELCTLHNILRDLTKVCVASGVLHLDDTELLSHQLAPLYRQRSGVKPVDVSKNVRVQVPAPALVRYLR